METEEWIPAGDFCTGYHIELSFILSLGEWGLIEIVERSHAPHINMNALQKLERMVRLHHEMDINIEGIGSIVHLLQQMEGMQDEIIRLQNRLRLYED